MVDGGSLSSVLVAFTALVVGTAVWWATGRAIRPPRSPQARMAGYLDSQRVSLGAPASPPTATMTGQALLRTFGPMAATALRAVRRLLLWMSPGALETALRQAGTDESPAYYRAVQRRWAAGAPLAGALLGVAAGRSSYVVALFLAGGFVGLRRPGERLRARIKNRNAELRADLPVVACVLAVKIDNNKSLMVAVTEVVEEGSGPIVEDLRRAVNLAHAGYGEARAFELIATTSAEPAAQRLYSFLAAATSGGLDLSTALLQQANEARQQRREELERGAARRQVSMVLPNLVFMTPVLFAFLLAPLPGILFGK